MSIWDGVDGRVVDGSEATLAVIVGPQGAVLVEAFAPRREDWDRLERRVSSPRWPES